MLIYNKMTGRILAQVSGGQTLETYGHHFPKEMIESLGVLYLYDDLENYSRYKIVDNNIVEMTDIEILEMTKYNRILSTEERLLEQLKPSHEEVQKAKNTIEILTLLQEVM